MQRSITILGGGEVDQRYATCYVYVFMFFQSVQVFFYPGQIWSTGMLHPLSGIPHYA